MGKKKKPKQEVTKYAMSIHFGICAGPVEYLSKIFIEEKTVWPAGTLPQIRGQGTFLLDQHELFGGYKKEGGVEGYVDWLPGASTQVMPERLAEKHGRTAATMPAYRGLASLFFSNRPGDDMRGFYWRANSPYLPGVWAEVGRASTPLGETHARIWRTDLKRISVFFALENNARFAGDRGVTMKAAMSAILDLLSEDVANGRSLDIAIDTFGLIEFIRHWPHATVAQIASLKAYVNALPLNQFDADWQWFDILGKQWFDYSAADTTIKRRIFIVVTAGRPVRWIIGTSLEYSERLSDESQESWSDMLTRSGGTYNTAAGTAVDMYGINVDYTDTHYLQKIDNTPGDGIPVVSGTDPTELYNAIFNALSPDGRLFDSNPAHMIYECLVDAAWGMGAASSAIDVGSFTAAAATLYGERFGLSMLWTRSGAIEDFIGEILDHIEATLFVNPRTGLLTLKLIRNDYAIPSLPVFTPDNSVVSNFSRKLWGETINEIVVTWTNPDNEEEETVVAQDLANIEAQGGVISDGRNYYGVHNASLATRLAHRDLRSASTPLAKCDLEVNRTAWALLPGDCCVLNSPEDGIDSIVMRVGPVDYGKPGDSTVRVSLMEDVFSLALADYSEPVESQWIDTSEPPTPIDYSKVITLPYYVVVNLIDASIIAGVDYPEVFAGVLAAETGNDADTFQLYGEAINASGVTAYTDFGTKRIVSRATLPDVLPPEIETTILSFPDRTQGNGPVVGGLMILQETSETVAELCLISDIGVGGYTFKRGVLDTVPRGWPPGTAVWFVDDSMDFIDDVDVRAAGEAVNYKILPTTSQGTLSESLAPIVSGTMTARPHLPLRPADVTVNSDDGFAGLVNCEGVDPIPVTWARRNRTTETALIKAWNDGDVSPEAGQTTIIEVLNDDRTAVLATHSGLAGTSFSVPVTSFAGSPFGWIRVGSERDGLRELQAYEVECRVDGDVLTLDADDLMLGTETFYLY